ncbi:sensor histidine kinase [Filimonas effusa]|uniref:Signal transduction histidine kinase internal region domain-containing protein n=1 Tax=Filimonas effusa TaxID=2508721 RepID=A0A4Q1D0Z8_9BACT|nr:histidine kinase [Filimonas effusa]RXK81443.1 hypothetical protein ESB13_21165 [Filimonas effusa]
MIASKDEKRISIYCAVVVAVVVNIPRISALRTGGLVNRVSFFEPAEFCFQLGYNFLFCYAVFAVNLLYQSRFRLRLLHNVLLLLFGFALGAFLQRTIFDLQMPVRLYRAGYFGRFFICMAVELLMVRIFFLLREMRAKEVEAEQARTRFAKAELELMKQQLNPHFFFNSLSTLSGIVREDPARAQRFISVLSKTFRNLLQKKDAVVSLRDELQDLQLYRELLYMRFENSISVMIQIPEEWMDKKLPHLSLQPLIENAAKHNKATEAAPLLIQLFIKEERLWVQNNLQPLGFVQEQSGTGLFNLNERCRILLGREITIRRNDSHFIVILPFE